MHHYLSILCILWVAAAVQAFPLDSAYIRGDSCLNVVWTPDSLNTKPNWYITNGALCTGADSVYRHSDFVAGVTYRSIAYSYGGEDPYFTFREKINAGFLAGSHLCHYQTVGDPTPYIAGTDCSGFVCYLWNVPRVSTVSLASNSQYPHISKSELRAGDLLVKSGSHAVFVVDQDDSTNFIIWESTSAVNGCRERVVNVNDAAWAQYVAIRNPNITSAIATARPGVTVTRLLGGAMAENGSKRFSLRLNRGFSGHVALYGLTGERLFKQRIDSGAGVLKLDLADPLAVGVYVVMLRSLDDAVETGALAVIK